MDTLLVVETSFSITHRGIIVFLQHDLAGLPASTRLRSSTNGQLWSVRSRVVYSHLMTQHRLFENETLDYMTLSFSDVGKLEASAARTQQQEQRGVYQYFLQGIGHDLKPQSGEPLELIE
jgi:hypothetical protein